MGVREAVLYCDGILTEAQADLEKMLSTEKERQKLSFLNTGGGLWSNNDNIVVNIYIKWYHKWFGDKE